MHSTGNGFDSRDEEGFIWSGVASAERPDKKGTQCLLHQAIEDIGEPTRLEIKHKTEGLDHCKFIYGKCMEWLIKRS